jgi:hypothetical protein
MIRIKTQFARELRANPNQGCEIAVSDKVEIREPNLESDNGVSDMTGARNLVISRSCTRVDLCCVLCVVCCVLCVVCCVLCVVCCVYKGREWCQNIRAV